MSPSRRWPLHPVLQLRQMELDREEQALARLQAAIAATEAALAATRTEQSDIVRARNGALLGGTLPAVHLRTMDMAAHALREREASLLAQLAEQRRLREEQMARYHAASERTELLKTLRDTHQANRQEAEARREQASAEQAHLARRFLDRQQR